MKRALLLFSSFLLFISLSACGSNEQSPSENSMDSGKPILSTVEINAGEERVLQGENTAHTKETPLPITEVMEFDQADASEEGMHSVKITIGDKVFPAMFYNNESAKEIIEQMPFSLNMQDYLAQEKVTVLPFDIVDVSTESPNTIHSGELYLWSGNSLVLFYTTFTNAYSYVPIGYIEDITGLAEALGSGGVQIAFAINE